jgi:hypothetical protein
MYTRFSRKACQIRRNVGEIENELYAWLKGKLVPGYCRDIRQIEGYGVMFKGRRTAG